MRDVLAGVGAFALVKFLIELIKADRNARKWLKEHPRKPWSKN